MDFKPKVVIIGLDGARLDIITHWTNQGYLPTFSKIMKEGVYGNLKSVLPIHSFTAWTSLSTGVYPPKHGVYDVLLRDKEGYRRIPPNSMAVRVKRFWEILDELGYKCCIINVPVTYPPKRLRHGVIISSVLTPSTSHTFAHPKKILEMLRNKGYKILPKAKPGTIKYIEEVHEILDLQYDFISWYLIENEWDLLFWVIMSTEMLHHHYASFIDKNHPLYNPEYEEIVRKLYVKIDKYIEKLLRIIGKDYTLFLVSDHGFAPYYGNLYLNAFLRKKDLLKTKSKLIIFKYYLLQLMKALGKKIYNYLPKNIKEKAIKYAGFGAYEFTMDLIDWSRTKAYVAFLDGNININLKKRESQGIVDKKDYDYIVNIVKNIINNDPVLSQITRAISKYEVYSDGVYLDLMPDVFLIFGKNNEKPFKIKTNPYSNILNYQLKQFKENIGYHTLYGIFFAYGSNIKKKLCIDAKIVDIAPTVLAIFGIEPPEYMNGKLLTQIFKKIPEVRPYTKLIISKYAGRLSEQLKKKIKGKRQ